MCDSADSDKLRLNGNIGKEESEVEKWNGDAMSVMGNLLQPVAFERLPPIRFHVRAPYT